MPIAPILMTPAYRFGSATPWGGDGLKRVFHKDIPDVRTGESLEVSAIPGLESRDPEGRTLTELMAQYGEKLTGKGYASPFPLLLKLLDARDTLSVQVHPNDAYAAQVEHKLGKTEAWHILSAAPGAQLVYGVKAGTTKEALLAASQAGAAVEKLLRRVDVKAGETYYIPAGMVHAIGEGIILYEIQQSSDVTYRFYDWERADKNGNKRELHIQKAVDVTRVDFQPDAVKGLELAPGHYRLLHEQYFSLDRFENGAFTISRDDRRFAFLTAVKDCFVAWDGGEMALPAGRTALLPADGYDLRLTAGEALMSYPTVE
ncbi:MAG: class I mannose-6-phosphate isomerase [Clostridia bacterium]|nr:class I mannose-6-phosphate isomerase [Clostridia bacterium]